MILATLIAVFFGFMFALSATSIWHDARLAILHWRATRAEIAHIDAQMPQVPLWILKGDK